MTIEIHQPGRQNAIKVVAPGLFDAVTAGAEQPVLLKALPETKGFVAFYDTNKADYKQQELIDADGDLFAAGEGLQLMDGVLAIGS